MKDKIMMFIIGLLVGAILATGAFYIYSKTAGKCSCSTQNTSMNGGQPPEMPNGQNSQPPEKPSDDNFQGNNTQDNN